LAEAHDLGLVHRDVKPANILLSPRQNEHEIAKVADYGLVKSIEAEPARAAITNVNTIFGTPLYMSPEAILTPDEVDGRSDLYALGAVAWFMLVGRTVFEGQSVVEICAQHLHQPAPRPSDVLGSVLPRDLEDIVLGCLEKKREARPADARVLRERLLSCSAAGTWSAAQAAEFWRARDASVVAEAAERPRSYQPLTLEIGGRAELESPSRGGVRFSPDGT
jgi:serine/threonine-protein kinase